MMNMINFLEKIGIILVVIALGSFFFLDTFVGSLILVISFVCIAVIGTIIGIIQKDTHIKFFILGDTLVLMGVLMFISIYYLKRDDIAMIIVALMIIFLFVFSSINNIMERRNK